MDEDLLTRLQNTAQECRQLIREMHEAQRDLSVTIKIGESLLKTIRTQIHDELEAAITQQIQLEYANTQKFLAEQIERTTRHALSTLEHQLNQVVDLGLQLVEENLPSDK